MSSKIAVLLHSLSGGCWRAGMAKLSEKQLWGAEKGMRAWETMVNAMSEEERSGVCDMSCTSHFSSTVGPDLKCMHSYQRPADTKLCPQG